MSTLVSLLCFQLLSRSLIKTLTRLMLGYRGYTAYGTYTGGCRGFFGWTAEDQNADK